MLRNYYEHSADSGLGLIADGSVTSRSSSTCWRSSESVHMCSQTEIMHERCQSLPDSWSQLPWKLHHWMGKQPKRSIR